MKYLIFLVIFFIVYNKACDGIETMVDAWKKNKK